MKEMQEELEHMKRKLVDGGIVNYASVVFQAFKVLEEDFTAVMRSHLGMKVHRKFVRKFRYISIIILHFYLFSIMTFMPF